MIDSDLLFCWFCNLIIHAIHISIYGYQHYAQQIMQYTYITSTNEKKQFAQHRIVSLSNTVFMGSA